MGLSPCLKFVIGRTLTILSWDNPVTAFFRKSKKLRHSLGRPSRSDFVQFEFLHTFSAESVKGRENLQNLAKLRGIYQIMKEKTITRIIFIHHGRAVEMQ